MRIITRKTNILAAIALLLAAAVGIIIFDRNTEASFEKKLEQASIFLERSDYDNAIAIYNGIIAEYEECTEAYIGLSDAYSAKNKNEKALQILERGLENADNEETIIEKITEKFPDYVFEDDEDIDDE